MPRPLPSPDGSSTHAFGHDAIALSLFVANVAATLALVSSMCSACGRRPKPAAASGSDGAGPGSNGGHGDDQKAAAAASVEEEEEEVAVTLSPELATHGPIAPVAPLPSSTSTRRLSVSLSKKLSVKVPDKLRLSQRERRDHHHKVESEDKLWKKGIIPGEKCGIPGERDEEASDPADENFRPSNYSRSNSGSFAAAHQQNDAPARVSRS